MRIVRIGSAERRGLAYSVLAVVLLAASIPLRQTTWTASANLHENMECIAAVLTLVLSMIALLRYRARKNVSWLLLTCGFLVLGLADGYHAVMASGRAANRISEIVADIISWTEIVPSIYLSVLACTAWIVWDQESCRQAAPGTRRTLSLLIAAAVGAFAVVLLAPLEQTQHSQFPIHRSIEVLAASLFAFATWVHLRKGTWKTGSFDHYLVLFLITSTMVHAVYRPFSPRDLDAFYFAAHLLKIVSYVFLLSGLLTSLFDAFEQGARSIRRLETTNESLSIEIEKRQRVEEALQRAHDNLEARVAARTADLAERSRLAALTAEIGVVLTHGDAVQETLQRSAELAVRFLEAAFVRVWTLNDARDVLELQASAGMYTHLDGPHGRVPVGQFKIGRIAQEGEPHLTNRVLEDSWVGDPDWAKREGMVAFAGYPLIFQDHVIGVLAGFARQPLSEATFQAFELLADRVAQFIGRKRVEAALLDSQERVRLLLDSTAEAIYGIDLQGRCTLANRACLRLLGYDSPEALLGRNMHDVMHHTRSDGSAYPVTECGIYRAFRKGEGSHVDNEVLWRSDGTSFPAEYWSYPVWKDGKTVGAVVTFLDISARKQAEEEKWKLVALVENSDDFIGLTSPDMKSLYLNAAGARMVGLDTPEQAIGMEVKQFHPESAWQRIQSTILPGIMQHGRCLEELQLRHFKTGAPIDVLMNAFIMRRPENGEILCLAAVMRDITERKRAQEAVSQLAAIVQSSEDAIIGTDHAGVITTWNHGAEKLLGYSIEDTLGVSLSILFRRADAAALILAPSACGELGRFDEAVFVRKDGLEVPVSLTVSPIRKASGEVIGAATIARDISAHKKAESELAHQARHDHLTGLPNRLLVADRLAATIARAEVAGLGAAVIYIDLDGFKVVNDTLGHEAGDVLLQQVTERLSRCIRDPDTLARMGGDEFMLVIDGIKDRDVALSIAERLRTALREPFSVVHHELYVTASIGISLYPQDGADVSALRRNADAAMYQAKHEGKDRIRFFTPAMGAAVVERLEVETELRRALDRNELSLHYQPIFHAGGTHQTAFEALLRWFHPTLGSVSPSRFIPIAEETGLIFRVGAWVLKEACSQCLAWQQRGSASVRVAVNVSLLEFMRVDFVDNVLRVLKETGLPGGLLELELTESILMRDMDDSTRKMAQLRACGVRISIDDFGTGYSSLSYLPRLPIDTLKIDRSFLAEIDVNHSALALIEGMISLAHSLGKRVVVEGVEKDSQLDVLRRLGCDEVQGYFLGRPGPLPSHSASLVESESPTLAV